MRLLSANADLLCSFSEEVDDDKLVRALDKHFQSGSLLQLVGNESMVVKRVRDHSHEVENVGILQSMLPSEHLVQVRRVIRDRWLLLEKVPAVFASMHSMHDLLLHARTVPCDVVQSCLAQTIALLCTAQESDPNFAHNDFKADNILLRLENRDNPLRIGQYEVKHVGVRVVLIDMETVTGTRFKPVVLPEIPKDKLELFGLDKDMPWCEWTDFHLLCMELFRSVRLQCPKWSAACLEFLTACAPNVRVFSTHEDKNILVTPMNRLSTKGRKTVNALVEAGAMKRLCDLATLPFLSPWIKRHAIETNNEMMTDTDTMPTQSPAENETT